MKIAYNPIGATALTTVPNDYVNDILFDLVGLNIFAKGTKFKGTDTTYSVFKKHTSANSGGYSGLVPVPSYTTTNNRYLREDGTWLVPSQYSYSQLNNTDLDTLKTEGRWYWVAGGSNNTNGPEGFNNGSELYIGRNASGYRYLKVITVKGIIWVRIWNGSWGAWTRWYTTDLKVRQSVTTATEFRPIVLGSKYSTSASDLATTITGEVHTTTKIYALPSTGTLIATKFQGLLDWSNITNKPTSFTPSAHTHSSDQITALTGYTKGTSDLAIETTDSLNVALGKLEYKGDLGVSAYNLITAANDGDGTIENLNEILKVLQGISDTDTIKNLLGKYLPLAGGTMAGNAFISWPDAGHFNQEGVTYPVSRGGLRWTGVSDSITLYAEETGNDNLDLVAKFGDDSSPALSIRDKNNAETIRLGVNGTVTATKLVKRGGAATQILMADGSITTKYGNTTVGALGWSDAGTGANRILTSNALAYWNGAYKDTASNLAYCKFGALGNIVTHSASEFVAAYGTSNDNIDSDWGQSIKTFDPIPAGTPPEQNPNITLLSMGDSFGRRKMLAFPFNNNNIYYRRHFNDSEGGHFTSWVKLLHTGNYESILNTKYVTLDTAQTITGVKTFTLLIYFNNGLLVNKNAFGTLVVQRNDTTNGASIQFRGSDAIYGYIGINAQNKDKGLLRWNENTSQVFNILDTGNYSGFLDSRYVNVSGDTMTGALNTCVSHGSWLTGMTNAAIKYNALKSGGDNQWESFLGIKTKDGHVVSFGTIFNEVSFNLYKAGRTNNGTDARLTLDATTGIWKSDHEIYAKAFKSTVGTGTAPFQCSSTTLNTNLNADLLDGYHFTSFPIKHKIAYSTNDNPVIKLLTFTVGVEKGGLAITILESHGSGRGLYYNYIVAWDYGTADSKALHIKCLYGTNSFLTRLFASKVEGAKYDLCYDVRGNSSVGEYILEHSSSCTINSYTSTAIAMPTVTYTSEAGKLYGIFESASKLQTARTIWGKSFDGTANISGDMSGVGTINMSGELKGAKKIFLNTGDATLKVYTGKTTDGQNDGNIIFQTSIDSTDGETHSYPTQYQRRCNIVLQPRGGQVYIGENPATGDTSAKLHVAGNVKATAFIGALQGNADSATKLQIKRTLWGQQFDGTADVSGNMTGVGSIIAVGQSRFTYNGGTYSDPASGVNSAIKIWGGLSQSGGDVLLATSSGNVAIGATSATEKLDVNGNAKVRGVLKIGNSNTLNYLAFHGTTGDTPNSFNHTWIAERIHKENESSELVLFKGNDPNSTDGPDRIRHIASLHLFQVYTAALSGAPDTVCNSTSLKNVFQIASSSTTSYVPLTVNGTVTASSFISNVALGTAPLLVTSSTVVSHLNADMLDGYHASSFMRMLGSHFGLYNLGIYTKILEFVIPSTTILNPSISFVWQPTECARNVWADFNINIRSGDVIFLANWKGVDRRNLWCVKNEDGVTYSVWVLGSKGSYDPYGVLLVIHTFSIKSYKAGSLAYSDEAPTGTAAKTTGWALRVVGTLTMSAGRFTASTFNGSANTTINIPTNTSHLTNDSGFWTGTKYWANVEVSSTSNTATTPTFATVTTSGDINIGGLLKRAGKVSTWVEGRNNALIRNTTYTGYNPILSMKTTNGSWDLGVYNEDVVHLSYITDTNFNDGHNTLTYNIRFPKKTGIVALTSDITDSYWANVKISTTSNSNTNPTFGNTIINGQLYIASNQDASKDKNGALVIGSKENANVAIDNNEVMARMNSATATLYLNPEGGLVQIGTGGLNVNAAALASGFKKAGSSDSYLLLGGGGHKAISDFMLKSDELNANITTIEKTLTVTSEWMDTGITGNLLASGSYIILLHLEGEYYTGVMSWYSDNTNDTESDEIILHRAGEAWGNAIYLRTCLTLTDNGGIKLLIAANTNLAEGNYVFKFKRMI